jgi:hypothetical protein
MTTDGRIFIPGYARDPASRIDQTIETCESIEYRLDAALKERDFVSEVRPMWERWKALPLIVLAGLR